MTLRPVPEAWPTVFAQNVPLYARLPPEDQVELQGHMQVLLAEKRFEGCNDLEITDEICATIAAQACLLLLHRHTDYYPRVSSILVYPTAFVVPLVEEEEDGIVVTESEEPRVGEAWSEGTVILSWEDVLDDANDVHDGSNVVLHEFAHQLDMEDEHANGAPILSEPSSYVDWARVLGSEYRVLRSKAQRGGQTVLDTYGAEDPAEFFAVATECFFERPGALKIAHPDLYAQLQHYYQQDPIAFGL